MPTTESPPGSDHVSRKLAQWARALTRRRTSYPPNLSVVGRQCIAAICVHRFCAHYGIQHSAIEAFVEHLWGVATVTADSFTEWENGFATLPASLSKGPLPVELRAFIPARLAADYSRLAEEAVECSASTWYGDNIPGTLEAFEAVLEIMARHRIPLPPFEPFLASSPTVLQGWGSAPTPEELRRWRSLA